MNDLLIQLQAENKILSHKLDSIRTFIERRMEDSDSIIKNELSVITEIIERYEVVTRDWELTKPLVDLDKIKEEE